MKPGVIAVSLIFISCVAVADYMTGYHTSVSLLYMVAIVLSVWFSWTSAAIAIALLSGISDSIATYIFTQSCQYNDVLNSVTQGVFFIVFALVLIALKRSQDSLKKLSVTDPLTQLANRRCFFDIGNAEAARAGRYNHSFSVIYIDVDNFKTINDTIGHSAGDSIFRDIAGRVKGTIRKTDILARLGGDEFAIVMPETGPDAVRSSVKRIQESLLGLRSASGAPVTFSMGAITSESQSCAFAELIKAADSLMYEVKRDGKHSVRFGLLGKAMD